MPLAALIVDDCQEVYEYQKGLQNKIFPMDCRIVRQDDEKVMIVVIWSIFWNFEWMMFNGVFRWLMKKGLKKRGYKGLAMPCNRLDIVKRLLPLDRVELNKKLLKV